MLAIVVVATTIVKTDMLGERVSWSVQ